MIECIRCGVCCIMAPCELNADSSGGCSCLTIHKEGYTSCSYIEENGNVFGGGCFLRRSEFSEMYKFHKELAEERVGIKLVGKET